SISVTLSAAANGTLSNLSGGSYNSGTGVYTLSGATLSAAQAALRALVFTPTANQAAVGQTVSTTFALTVNDGVATTSDSSTSVVATSVNDAPTIGGTSTSNVNDNQTANPFSGVVLADVDPGQTYSISVTLSAAANGTLSNLSGGSYNSGT